MKLVINHPFSIYLFAGIACLCIMLIIDYILGAEAQHLNAWVILQEILGHSSKFGDSLALQKMGLAGATILTIVVNGIFGFLLIQLLHLIVRLF